MKDLPLIEFWRGRRLTELSQAELIEALKFQTRMLEEERQRHMATLRVLRDLRIARNL